MSFHLHKFGVWKFDHNLKKFFDDDYWKTVRVFYRYCDICGKPKRKAVSM